MICVRSGHLTCFELLHWACGSGEEAEVTHKNSKTDRHVVSGLDWKDRNRKW